MIDRVRNRGVACFDRTGAGDEPVRAFLDALPRADRRVAGRDIARVEFGWPIGMPEARGVG